MSLFGCVFWESGVCGVQPQGQEACTHLPDEGGVGSCGVCGAVGCVLRGWGVLTILG
jgi:hypothetical protein